MFDFSNERKEKYYRIAEERLKEAGLNFLKIDRSRFAAVRNEVAKVHLVHWLPKNVNRSQLAALKALNGFVIDNDRYHKRKKGTESTVYEIGHFEIKLEAEDK